MKKCNHQNGQTYKKIKRVLISFVHFNYKLSTPIFVNMFILLHVWANFYGNETKISLILTSFATSINYFYPLRSAGRINSRENLIRFIHYKHVDVFLPTNAHTWGTHKNEIFGANKVVKLIPVSHLFSF